MIYNIVSSLYLYDSDCLDKAGTGRSVNPVAAVNIRPDSLSSAAADLSSLKTKCLTQALNGTDGKIRNARKSFKREFAPWPVEMQEQLLDLLIHGKSYLDCGSLLQASSSDCFAQAQYLRKIRKEMPPHMQKKIDVVFFSGWNDEMDEYLLKLNEKYSAFFVIAEEFSKKFLARSASNCSKRLKFLGARTAPQASCVKTIKLPKVVIAKPQQTTKLSDVKESTKRKRDLETLPGAKKFKEAFPPLDDADLEFINSFLAQETDLWEIDDLEKLGSPLFGDEKRDL